MWSEFYFIVIFIVIMRELLLLTY